MMPRRYRLSPEFTKKLLADYKGPNVDLRTVKVYRTRPFADELEEMYKRAEVAKRKDSC